MSQPMQPGQDSQSSDSNIVPVCISYPNRARMFDPNITLDELLGPDSTGGDRIDMIIDMYRIGVPDITPWYYNNGEKTFVTHEQNDRRHSLWDDELSTSFLERGVVVGVSGAPWGQYSVGNVLPLRMLSWGSRCRGFYHAHAEHPEPKVIVKELTKGLCCHRFHDQMQVFVVEYMVNFHNTFHRGAGVSFLEVQSKALEYEALWRTHCKDTCQTVRSIGNTRYEAMMLEFVMKHSNGVLDDGEQYNRAKVFFLKFQE